MSALQRCLATGGSSLALIRPANLFYEHRTFPLNQLTCFQRQASRVLDLPCRSCASTTTAAWTAHVPKEHIKVSFARSSGAGGQNVNKLNTKVELRFNLDQAAWIPPDVARRLQNMYNKHCNKEGDFIVTSEKHRTQHANQQDAFQKLQRMLQRAAVPPKSRKQWQGLAEATKAARVDFKKKRSEVKARRRGSGDD